MIIQVSNVIVGLDKDQNSCFGMACKTAGLLEKDIKNSFVVKKSVDARKKSNIQFNYTIGMEVEDGTRFKESNFVKAVENTKLEFTIGDKKLSSPPVIVGFGPAGIFCGLYLARMGYKPIILERGQSMENRVKDVDDFTKKGVLNPKSNVQFGEGGAGTFSDGKLTTRINDKLCNGVLEDFVKAGAPAEILQMAKPHIGTDKLRGVIKNLREEIEELGGEIHFNTSLEKIGLKDGKVVSAITKDREIPTEVLVFATGHSARDTFKTVFEQGVAMESKVFSVGARIEHLQEEVDAALYGEHAGNPLLPKGEYQLSWRDKNASRGVYTFCMCPGGVVVPSQSEENTVVTNGMSYYSRAGKNANSALVVNVSEADFGKHPLDGMNFQQEIERKAFKLTGGYAAPYQTVGGFLGKGGCKSATVTPTYSLGVKDASMEQLLPSVVCQYMKNGLEIMARKQSNFANYNGVLTGPETRTSSPVRILRDVKTGVSVNTEGLYPAGEGSGYAGGIMSASVDGIRTAEKIISVYKY